MSDLSDQSPRYTAACWNSVV